MGAANFRTMEEFPLFVHDDFWIKPCPVCGLWHDTETKVCDDCGADLKDVPEEKYQHDELTEQIYFQELQDACEELTGRLLFHKVEPLGGYYCGVQLYVEETDDPNDMDNYTTRYMYDMFRSQAIRAYDREKRKIVREMRRIAKRHGMTEMYCSARFSNGECWYSKVPEKKATKHERVRYAVAQ